MSARRTFIALLVVATAMVAACAPPPAPQPPGPGPLSLGEGGVYGNGSTTGASISGDGRFVAFTSDADNLVPGDTNDATDTFLRNRVNGSVQRVAESTVGEPRISGNGRYVSYVAFGGTYGVYDRITGTSATWNTSVARQTPVVPDDGSVAIFGRTGSLGIFSVACRVRTLATGAETDCPHGGPGYGTVALDAVSRNGRFVLYYWLDQDGGGTSARLVWDRATGSITPAPVGLVVFGNSVAISDDGRYIAATDFTPDTPWTPRLFDRQTGSVTSLPGPAPDGATIPSEISANSEVIALYSEAGNLDPTDTNGVPDMYLWDLAEGTVTLASKRLDTPAPLATGSAWCGAGPGHMLASGGGLCILASEPLLAADTNGATDAWLVPD